MLKQPTLSNLTKSNFGEPAENLNPLLQSLGAPHVASFNFMTDGGLEKAIADIPPVHFELPNGDRLCLKVEGAAIAKPHFPAGTVIAKDLRIFPKECRQRVASYRGRLTVQFSWSVNDRDPNVVTKDLGDIPIMVKSNRCHLQSLSPKELVERGEHEQEWGGYFIIKGHERLVRMLIMTRRNFPLAIKRPTWKARGQLFSEYGVFIRCVREDETTANNVLHFVSDGTTKVMIGFRKILYYIPLVLIMKCLCNYTDYFIYQKLMQGYEDDLYYSDCVQNMLRELHLQKLHTQEDCKNYIGKIFRTRFLECPPWFTDVEVADTILKRCVLIHLDDAVDKFNLLVFMTQKLYCFVQDRCAAEKSDAVMMQEVLMGGHLYLQILKEKIHGWLIGMRMAILKRATNPSFALNPTTIQNATKWAGGVENALENFFATGNVSSPSGLGLLQDKGLTIVVENINRMRYMSHFRSVHRGAFFQEMRSTEPRQLLPDAWGFICPVHTPDGAPCGLLNHLTLNCMITEAPDPEKVERIPSVLIELGLVPIQSAMTEVIDLKEYYVTQLDGRILGYVKKLNARRMVDKLRVLKIKGEVPETLEIVLVPFKKVPLQFAGIFLFTRQSRMMRPVINLAVNKVELIGTFEQVYMDIAIIPEEIYKGVTTHMELSKTSFLSGLANLIPMPDCNQSPRNMYQCQMGKQTMGTPCHNWQYQAESKLYRLQTPASPLFRPVHHDNIQMDDFAMGTNAIVAVISYTGYDMEDAMVINKASEERGLAHGSIYKSEFAEVDDPKSYFCRDPENPSLMEFIDTDGLPFVGRRMEPGAPLYCYFSAADQKYMVRKFGGKEVCYVDSVRLCGTPGEKALRLACITFRVPRNPSVGDKFASRAGQKGICSQRWPMEDLPFTETGLVPDIVFNPHGFPSRMTIAMMIEIMAGKSAALHGLVHDATPFKFTEENSAIDYFGKLLEAGGYNYYGTETMYSGIDGREMNAQIFFGVVHYQRLRHMVSDKWQVRSTGPIDALTRQPVKGRQRGGGVRFGEMERDALISHGTAFLLQDRLFHCSDKTTTLICTSCGTLLGPVIDIIRLSDKPNMSEFKKTCRLCKNGDNVSEIEIPYIFKFFVTQLASCNINVRLDCKHV